MSSERHTLRVQAEDVGLRLDQFLAARVPDLSRRRARVAIDLGGVFIDGRRTKVAGRLVREGEQVVVSVGGALERATKEVGAAARARDEARLPVYAILHEDEDLIVVDKPAGLLTAPTPESDRGNLAGLLERRGARRGRIFVVHRLDLGTSGVLVFAKSEDANRVLSERFRVHDMERAYLAVVEGAFPEGIARVDAPIEGRHAITRFSVLERFGARATWLRCRLETGRTHQIRIHCAGLGCPVAGDGTYGARVLTPPRIALHATLLAFEHPRTGEAMRFERPWPEDLTPFLESLRAPA